MANHGRYHGTVVIAPPSEKEYFRRYRCEHPIDEFPVYTLEEVQDLFCYDMRTTALHELVVIGFSVETAKRLLPLLKHMTAPTYRSEELKKPLQVRDLFLKKGILTKKRDPAEIFCDKTILIRGYYAGKAIAEALQDLPNISLNWDIETKTYREEPLPIEECDNLLQAASRAKYHLDDIRNHGGKAYLRFEGTYCPLSNYPIITGPYLPSDGETVYLEKPLKPVPSETQLFSAAALAELHVASQIEQAQRDAFDKQRFLLSGRLRAHIYCKK